MKGTHAHAYITSFSGIDELKKVNLRHKTDGIFNILQITIIRSVRLVINEKTKFDFFQKGTVKNLLELAVGYRQKLSRLLEVSDGESSDGELAAMVSFAIAFPDGFMALVDTYDVKRYFFCHSCRQNTTAHQAYQTLANLL